MFSQTCLGPCLCQRWCVWVAVMSAGGFAASVCADRYLQLVTESPETFFLVLILRCACVCAPLSLTVCFCHCLYLRLQDRAAWESRLWWTRCLSLKSAVALCCPHPRRRSPKQLKLSPSVTVWKPPSPLVCQPIDFDLLLLCLILLYPFTFFSFVNLTLYVLLV